MNTHFLMLGRFMLACGGYYQGQGSTSATLHLMEYFKAPSCESDLAALEVLRDEIRLPYGRIWQCLRKSCTKTCVLQRASGSSMDCNHLLLNWTSLSAPLSKPRLMHWARAP